MRVNMGTIDRLLRTLAAIIVAVLYFTDQTTGVAASILGIVAVVFLFTSLVGFCPLYVPLKISSKKEQKSKGV